MARTITLRLEGTEIPAQVFNQKFGTFLTLLRDVDRNLTRDAPSLGAGPPSVRWVIESIRSGSPIDLAMRAEPIADTTPPENGDAIVQALMKGLAELESPSPLSVLPAYFDIDALEQVRGLVQPAHGVTAVSVSTPDYRVPVMLHENANLHRFLRPVFEHSGSIEGKLEVVSVAGGTSRFIIRDRLSGRGIRCTIPRERLPEILRVFDRRIVVNGRVKVNEQGDVLGVQMEEVEAFQADEDLPGIEQVAGGFDLTKGRSVGEHLDKLRNAS